MLAEGGQLGKSGSNLSEGSPMRESQGKPGHRSCLSPGAVPYSRDRTEVVVEESARRNMCADMRPLGTSSSGERHRIDHPHKDGSSSDTESDFYEEIDVSCTPESMDYPTSKGRKAMLESSTAGFLLSHSSADEVDRMPSARLRQSNMSDATRTVGGKCIHKNLRLNLK